MPSQKFSSKTQQFSHSFSQCSSHSSTFFRSVSRLLLSVRSKKKNYIYIKEDDDDKEEKDVKEDEKDEKR